MYSKILNLYKVYQRSQYQNMHKTAAYKKLRQLESTKGKLSEDLRQKCDKYAEEVLGGKEYAPWLYVYTKMHNEFKEGWIPDNYYGEVVVPKLKGDYGKIANLKTLQAALFNSDSFPDLFYYVNGQWLSKNYEVLTKVYVEDYIRTNLEKYVYKIDNSQSGKGVYIIDQESNENQGLKALERRGNGVLQSFIHQHVFFDEIMPNSVATIRLTSTNDELGDVSLRGAYLRVGRNTDNKVTSASGIRIPIDINTGVLGEFCYDNDLNERSTHPDTGFIFKEQVIPNFKEMIEKVTFLHLKVPFARIIGWDLVLDRNNKIQVMEWNGMHNTIYFDELTKGPIFEGLNFEDLWKDKSK